MCNDIIFMNSISLNCLEFKLRNIMKWNISRLNSITYVSSNIEFINLIKYETPLHTILLYISYSISTNYILYVVYYK